ncbi:hypothetical protein GCM10010172_60270 [Paractinoplanes ferrugineus]|uniref:Knr4/Smi1-like domain-containing protein n=1 Tax=Paractinoplanes ferrugineus TaxID=113564 RepID=A0A919J8X5_9ACTN|nr:SMI1/KNR4 family protein [Actinoplanes ferrugineus]GIE16705.1 hypothetical protein Afe05nite_85450 [Actinoplanes ferrugineus]
MENYADRLANLLGVADDAASCSWEAVEEEIGSPLPGDYKELIDHTGSAVFDDRLSVFAPSSSEETDLASLIKERDWAWEYLREDVDLPERFFTEDRRLIAFAAIDACYFYWDARDGSAPEDWGVVIVDGDLQNWFELPLSATECLYKILVGEIELPPFEGFFGSAEHSVGRFGS